MQGVIENIRYGESEGLRKLDYCSVQRKIIILSLPSIQKRVSSLPCARDRDVHSSATLLRRYDTRSAKKHVGNNDRRIFVHRARRNFDEVKTRIKVPITGNGNHAMRGG
jgi:hypothetical protein